MTKLVLILLTILVHCLLSDVPLPYFIFTF
jgi:hypothetical protein